MPVEEENAVLSEGDGLAELKEWLFEEVADDRDIVVDEMQSDFAQHFQQEEESLNECEGSDLYRENIKHLEKGIAKLKTPEGRNTIKVSKDKQKITDGIRPCWYGGARDASGLPHGEGMLKYDNDDVFTGVFNHGVLEREGKIQRAKENSLKIEGKWVDGLMEGEMKVETHCGGWIEGYFSKGVPHGFQREFGPSDIRRHKKMLKFVGRYYRGIRRGFCWQGCFGGGFLAGRVDPLDGSWSGDDIAYIYPDFKHAIKGQFKDELLVKGKMCNLTGSVLEHGMRVPIFSDPCGQEFTYEAPTRRVIARNPTLQDPWEDQVVYVKESQLPQGGEGLFARRDIKRQELISLFNGVRLKTATLESKYSESDYRIRLNADLDLDIPHAHIDLDKYCATLGHKANHSFVANAEWALVEHPRFGLIRGLASLEDIKKDDEILINYQMNLADAPDWYKFVWLKHQREVKKCSDDAIGRILDRYTENTGKRVYLPDCEGFVVPEPKGIDDDDEEGDEETTGGQLELPHADMIEEMDRMKRLMKIKEANGEKEEPKIVEMHDFNP